MISEVNYFGNFSINYNIIDSHLEHAPMKATAKGKIWEKKLFHLYSQILEEDDIAIDIGSYIGTHSLPMSKLCSKVYSFEANADIYFYLIKNIALNHISNIVPFNIALSRNKSKVNFFRRDDGTSRISNRFQRGSPTELETDTLDNLIDNKEKIKLIKIDVEGHEFQVLEGAKEIIKNSRPIIFIEVFKNKLDKLTQWAEQNNYKIESIRGEDYLLTPNNE